MNHVEIIDGVEEAIAALLEKMNLCEFYASVYIGVPLPLATAGHETPLQRMLDSVLPEFYAAVIAFTVKARAYFEAKGMYVVI